MNIIMRLFGIPLGWIMHFIYKFIPNYGIALFIFTLLSRILLIPVTIKQQKSSAKMAALQPKIQEIQTKYASDRMRMQEELGNLYAEENYSPTSGCLPMLIQFPILFGLIDVIYRPLTHILRLPNSLIQKGFAAYQLLGMNPKNPNAIELDILRAVKGKPLFFGMLGTTALQSINEINYSFLGLDLTQQPEWSMFKGIFTGHFNPVILIPILSGVTALLTSIITTKASAAAAGNDPSTAGMMKGMMLMMPFMSLWIAFTVPAGVGLYWIYSNVLGLVQNILLNKFHNPKDIQAKLEAEQKARKEQERLERIEAKRKLKAGLLGEENADKALTQKEIDRLRLAAARKRDAEKYGDPIDD